MHKKIPKICTGCRVSEAKIYLCHSTEIAKVRPHSEEWQTDTSVQKQWSMDEQVIHLYYLDYVIQQLDSETMNRDLSPKLSFKYLNLAKGSHKK